jgi:geranylgeranyl reductase family protein
MIALDKKVEWQQPLVTIPEQNWDVVIIGAGPAGAIAAVHLAAADHKVLLLDKEHFPREKICGDGLLPDALRCLDYAGIGKRVRQCGHLMHTATIVKLPSSTIDVPGTYLTLKRCLLDTMAAQRAVEAGAVFAHGKVDRIFVRADESVSFAIRGNNKKYTARIGIIATGANVRLLKEMGWFVPRKPSAVALRGYVRSSFDLDHLVVAFVKSLAPGYGWIFPLGNREYNIGCGLSLRGAPNSSKNLRKFFDDFINEFPLARELMQSGTIIRPLRAAALRSDFEGVYPFVKGPLITVGETIGTTLPFLSEGTGKAMETGQLAAEIVHMALISGDITKLKEYPERLTNDFKPRYKGYRTAESWIAKPWLSDFVFGRIQKSKYLGEVLSGIMAETYNPRELFSVNGIVKSFWK